MSNEIKIKMTDTATGKYIAKQIDEYKALKTKEEKEQKRTSIFRNVKAALNVNIEALDEDTIKRYEYDASKALDLLEEKDYVINIKFGSSSVGELKFRAYNRAEAEEKAKVVGGWIEDQYREELKKIAKKRMDEMKAEEQEQKPEVPTAPAK
jgi:uncharacterized protein YbaA (DUF1428 family)